MKAFTYISGLALLVLSSCSSGLYTSREYDDLYYTSSDREAEGTTVIVRNRPVERDLRAEEYYDNIYAADTLVSEEYAEAAANGMDAQGGSIINNYYYDNSYSSRLRMFYGNYFDPYWRDPFYYSYFPYAAYSYGGWGYPYSYSLYDPFYYDPYFYDPFYYGSFSRYGYYGSYYPYYYSSYYSPFYSPFYNRYYGYYYNDEVSNVSYGRRERSSTLSTRYNNSVSGGVSSVSRRDSYLSGDVSKTDGDAAKSAVETTSAGRRSISSDINRSTTGTTRAGETQNPVRQSTDAAAGSATRRVAVERPEYNSTSRSYTPSYTNPRTSTRPSYNNTRVGTDNAGSGSTRVIQTPSGVRSGSSTYSPSRSGSGSSGVYSVPSRSGSSSSSPASRSYSSPGTRSSSYSSGSSYSGSYSGGSSSSGSSSSSSSGSSRSSGSSSGGRR